jgi:hypothetical protein
MCEPCTEQQLLAMELTELFLEAQSTPRLSEVQDHAERPFRELVQQPTRAKNLKSEK